MSLFLRGKDVTCRMNALQINTGVMSYQMHCRFFLACPTPAELHFLPIQQVRACGILLFIQMRHSQNKLYKASKPLVSCYQRRKICTHW